MNQVVLVSDRIKDLDGLIAWLGGLTQPWTIVRADRPNDSNILRSNYSSDVPHEPIPREKALSLIQEMFHEDSMWRSIFVELPSTSVSVTLDLIDPNDALICKLMWG